jgi:Rrf2 family protein
VRISAKTEYASIAMLELAAAYGSGEPVRIRSIADAHGIPARFLVQILLQLKGAGYVTSTRGASGGYQLSMSPERITLGEVMNVIDGQEEEIRSSTAAASPASRVLVAAWNEVAATERRMLRAMTFAELATRLKKQAENMYYI